MRRIVFLTLMLLLAVGAYLYMRPVPVAGPLSQIVVRPKTQATDLAWPSPGQAAIGASGYGLLAAHDTDSPVPIASVAKVITALAVLQKSPISPDAKTPLLTIYQTDVDSYHYYLSQNGSVAPVSLGENLSEYQALQALLIPSANNVADSLTRWLFGSDSNYVAYANQMLKGMGLTKTTVGDASGFADNTTSTADELVKLGLKAMQNPVIAKIVSQPVATIPVAGDIKNVNWLLGDSGIVGIKTGNTDKAGGCYLFAAKRQVQNQTVTVVGAILGVGELNDAISDAKPLLESANHGFGLVTPVHKGQVLGNYRTAWGSSAQAKASKDLSLLVWKGKDIKILNEPDTLTAPVKSGSIVGKVSAVSSGVSTKTNLVLDGGLSGPSLFWRIFH
ncbi:D-alanyl-D-alanine carboxypeptidase [Candidatus Saccharibacteria bacterium]|nr:D-alanyl-D-alanine carboxypeptidase [Candidatus Saccharibacteria bacterium]